MTRITLHGEIARLVHIGERETVTYDEIDDTVILSRSVLSRLVTHCRAFALLSQEEQEQLLEMERETR